MKKVFVCFVIFVVFYLILSLFCSDKDNVLIGTWMTVDGDILTFNNNIVIKGDLRNPKDELFKYSQNEGIIQIGDAIYKLCFNYDIISLVGDKTYYKDLPLQEEIMVDFYTGRNFK